MTLAAANPTATTAAQAAINPTSMSAAMMRCLGVAVTRARLLPPRVAARSIEGDQR